ncbi:MAG: dihydrofolate reductase family protein [Planctomycetota bacterium]
MPKGVVYVGISIDGYLARADHSLDWLPDPPEGEDFGWAPFIASIDHMVMGRGTFEVFRTFGAWPYGDIPLTVLSRSQVDVPESLAPRVTLSDLAPRDLFATLEGRIYVDGGRLVRSFLAEDLIDEMILTRVPVTLGGGIPLFGETGMEARWTLSAVEPLGEGIVRESYLRAR